MKNTSVILPSRYPLIQAPMAGAQDSALAIAVCESGGLGSLPAAMLSIEALDDAIKSIQAATSAPFNVNFFAHTMPEHQPKQIERWHHLLQPYFDQWQINVDALAPGILRLPFHAEHMDVIQTHRPAVVSFHFGLPEAKFVQAIKAAGALILSSATTLAEGEWLAAHGVDMVIAQGSEAGGHRASFLPGDMAWQMGTFALTTQLAAKLPVPVVAAGGISNTRGIQAAFDLGAQAVQLGTAYLLCSESRISPLHRAAIVAAQQSANHAHTAITNVFSGKPARGLVNRLMCELGYLNEHVAPFPYASVEISALRQSAETQGNTDFTPLWCGQNPQGAQAIDAKKLTTQLTQIWSDPARQ
ncbi:nitronate monooxygenase family protein [Snodgrassella sp. CFCC 13594]|uniref:NAD(P)H-dependent flavin oxidoreductase n=1 Tax=Snodgrassella sp. CFCC 13594 TaxID=1775559 RepID=UPI00082D6FB5|nr:nitronate monooxygenase [Snodgrassella sp. CFCC 13594]